ncbi:hypothetical protein LEP1GSC125_3940 [Leptospira mayottensis 200901122]|uniref:Uncharacterized protein n=1 Tax=Leptospira mayottensis 200901122 TaxID=1193010 RepID=A0AA87MSX5_9LEPT|nr:hypothetical protein LEP1GSC125_3940 [Leptospira mayottensis 200901122]
MKVVKAVFLTNRIRFNIRYGFIVFKPILNPISIFTKVYS